MQKNYTLDDFNFELPETLIAQKPASPRNHARLLVYDRKTKQITNDYFYNLEKYLPKDTTLALNNSKVEKCRLRFPGKVEIFVIETNNDKTVRAMVFPGKKFKVGDRLSLADGIDAKVTDIDNEGLRTIVFNKTLDDAIFDKYRLTPMPPYIAQDETLAEEYQTVYADPLGSKAAPTAGLHFTNEQLIRIGQSHQVAEVTLHVGLGTFAPVKTNDLENHHLHEESYSIDQKTALALNHASHITAVGTTTVRTLESAQHPFQKEAGATSIFIRPGYSFQSVNSLITNFHLPKSTLLMLVAAFLGSVDELHRIYDHAIKEQYRFYSFGDAMLIL